MNAKESRAALLFDGHANDDPAAERIHEALVDGMGAGGMIGGRPLREIRGMMLSAVRALDLSAADLAAGRPVPDEAVRLMAMPAIPAFAYRIIANHGWRSELKRQGAAATLDALPFA